MKRNRIDSTTLLSAGYDARKQVLELEFISQDVYQYVQVPKTVYDALLQAESPGAYFNQYIRDRFRYKKIDP